MNRKYLAGVAWLFAGILTLPNLYYVGSELLAPEAATGPARQASAAALA